MVRSRTVNIIRRERILWIGLLAWSGLLTLAAYGPALSLPFFFDDFAHIPFVDAHSLPEIWQTSGGLAYYRPLAFTLWKLMYLLLGHHDPVAQHAVNLIVHWANGLLVAWLAGRLWSRAESSQWPRRYLSATLFLLFPFSYQAVPWVGSLAHPLVTALILLSLVTYLKFREAGRHRWAVLSLALAFLSPFAHENGALIGPLIAAIEWTQPSRTESLGRGLRRAIAWSVPALIWFPIWWLAPKAIEAGSTAANAGEALLQNSVYFLQGVAYPITWLGGWLRDAQGINDLVAVLVLSVPLLLVAALVQWRKGADRRALLPWLWCGLTSLPAVIFLTFDYVINGPRLLMLASVGAAWLWTDVGLRVADSRFRMWGVRPARVLVSLAVPVVLIQNYTFIRDRMVLHELGGSAIRQAVAATTAANDDGQVAIFINLPAWIAPAHSVFALGHEGVQFLPGYVPPETLASINTGRAAALKAIRADAIRSEMPYLYGLRGQAPDWPELIPDRGRVFIARYAPDKIVIEPVGELSVTPSSAEQLAQFGDGIGLLDATSAVSGRGVEVRLTWQVLEPPAPDVTVFVHLLDANGNLIAQADGDPLAGTFPFAQWPAGLIVRDQRAIEVSGSGLSLRVGLYDRATGERLMALSADGAPFADNAVPVSFQPAP